MKRKVLGLLSVIVIPLSGMKPAEGDEGPFRCLLSPESACLKEMDLSARISLEEVEKLDAREDGFDFVRWIKAFNNKGFSQRAIALVCIDALSQSLEKEKVTDLLTESKAIKRAWLRELVLKDRAFASGMPVSDTPLISAHSVLSSSAPLLPMPIEFTDTEKRDEVTDPAVIACEEKKAGEILKWVKDAHTCEFAKQSHLVSRCFVSGRKHEDQLKKNKAVYFASLHAAREKEIVGLTHKNTRENLIKNIRDIIAGSVEGIHTAITARVYAGFTDYFNQVPQYGLRNAKDKTKWIKIKYNGSSENFRLESVICELKNFTAYIAGVIEDYPEIKIILSDKKHGAYSPANALKTAANKAIKSNEKVVAYLVAEYKKDPMLASQFLTIQSIADMYTRLTSEYPHIFDPLTKPFEE